MNIVVNFYKRLTPLQRSLVGALFGFAFYGGWAMLVNLMHGKESAIKAGFVQGIYSFILTFVMTLLLETLFYRMKASLNSDWLAGAAAVFMSCTVVFTGSWLVNYWSGTPEIFRTVILGYILGGLYSTIYATGLVRQSRSYMN